MEQGSNAIAGCPYCGTLLEKKPMRASPCPHCKQRICVLNGVLYTETQRQTLLHEQSMAAAREAQEQELKRLLRHGFTSVRIECLVEETCGPCLRMQDKVFLIEDALANGDLLPRFGFCENERGCECYFEEDEDTWKEADALPARPKVSPEEKKQKIDICLGSAGDFVALDFETANEDRDSACAIGMIVVEGGNAVEQMQMLIRPQDDYFNPFNVAIHGITWEDVEHEPEFAELWPAIQDCIGERMVVAHCASFDMSVLRYTLDSCGLSYPELSYTCTMVMARQLWPHLVSYGLTMVADYIGIDFEHHNPLEDALTCAKIAARAFKETESQCFSELAEKLNMVHGRIFPGGYNRSGKRRATWKPSDLVAATDEFDVQHPFYGKTIVFTGTLQSLVRKDAMQQVLDVGGECAGGVNKNTNVLVVGEQDLRRLKGGNRSSKMIKAEKLASEGKEIEIIGERDFLAMLHS